MSQDKSTKEKIIEAAKDLFLAHGFAGASMGQIGRCAGVNHSLLFYHFKNKENLWMEVKHYIAKTSVEAFKVIPDITLESPLFVRELFKNSIEFYKMSPDIVRMLNWQRLESGDNPGIGATLSDEMQQWIEVFNFYKKNGAIKDTVKPEFIITMILSLAASIALDNYYFFSQSEERSQYTDFCVNTVLKAVTK